MVTTKEMKTETSIHTSAKRRFWRILLDVVCSALIVLALFLFFSATWYKIHYGNTGFDSVLFTLFSEMGGVSPKLIFSFIFGSILPTVLLSIAFIFALYFLRIKKEWFQKLKYWHRTVMALILALLLFILAGTQVNIFGYIHKMMLQTTLYEDYYVEPSKENIQFPEKKRNLVYIFLESMETTYMSQKEGGGLSKNVIPELTELSKENINFSHNSGVGGFHTPTGTTWTVAGMVAHTSGVPLKGSSGVLENNEYGKEEFLPGVITLSDILHENGYKQALMVGSESSFANRDVYYKNHHTDEIFDLDTAKKDGVVSDDYYVWWGMEDFYLFDYAKDKLTEMAKGEEPFSFTLLTVDTHFPDGYICAKCENKHKEQYENVLSCASHQVDDFIEWLKKQKFYENTTVIICGDHLTMDNQYIERNVDETYERHGFNCFMNSAIETKHDKNRIFTSLDLFPTTLAALGCEIEGDRLGLGTNLFSGKPTLAEEMGYDAFNHKLLYSSNYYIKKFMVAK